MQKHSFPLPAGENKKKGPNGENPEKAVFTRKILLIKKLRRYLFGEQRLFLDFSVVFSHQEIESGGQPGKSYFRDLYIPVRID